MLDSRCLGGFGKVMLSRGSLPSSFVASAWKLFLPVRILGDSSHEEKSCSRFVLLSLSHPMTSCLETLQILGTKTIKKWEAVTPQLVKKT